MAIDQTPISTELRLGKLRTEVDKIIATFPEGSHEHHAAIHKMLHEKEQERIAKEAAFNKVKHELRATAMVTILKGLGIMVMSIILFIAKDNMPDFIKTVFQAAIK